MPPRAYDWKPTLPRLEASTSRSLGPFEKMKGKTPGALSLGRRRPRWRMLSPYLDKPRQQRARSVVRPGRCNRRAAPIHEVRSPFIRRLGPATANLPYSGSRFPRVEASDCWRKRDLVPIESTQAVSRTSILFVERSLRISIRIRPILPKNEAENVETPQTARRAIFGQWA